MAPVRCPQHDLPGDFYGRPSGAAVLERADLVVDDFFAVAVSGQSVSLTADTGVVSVGAPPVTAVVSRRIDLGAGAVALVGFNAKVAPARCMLAATGLVSIGAQPVTAAVSRRIDLGAGAIALAGTNADLVKKSAAVLAATSGAIICVGSPAAVFTIRQCAISPGGVMIAGVATVLVASRLMAADGPAVYSCNGFDSSLVVARLMAAGSAEICCDGAGASMSHLMSRYYPVFDFSREQPGSFARGAVVVDYQRDAAKTYYCSRATKTAHARQPMQLIFYRKKS